MNAGYAPHSTIRHDLLSTSKIDSSNMPPTQEHNLPSNRSFGWLFAAIFGALAAYLFWRGSQSAWVFGSLATSAAFALATLIAPHTLSPLNRLWFNLGLLLGRIVSPIVLGIIFFLLITPVSLVGRALGRDELKLKKRDTSSYWVDRSPPGPPSDSFRNQY